MAAADDTFVIPDGMEPCEHEDSYDCYWDASERGNGIGESFIAPPAPVEPELVVEPAPAPPAAPVPEHSTSETVPSTPVILAETGPEDVSPDVLIGGILLVVVGVMLWWKGRAR